MNNKVIITAAITGGIHVPSQSPYLPIKPKEIADEAVRAWEAGAAVAHIHARDPETGKPSSNIELFKEIASSIKARCDVILCITTGGGLGMTPEERIAVVSELHPELASFNLGSINFSLHPMLEKIKEFKYSWEREYLAASEDNIFPNTFRSMKYFAQIMHKCGTKPEFEVYDVAHINNLKHLLDSGVIIGEPIYLQFVMGILGGIPATVENLVFLLQTARQVLPSFTWSVCVAGRWQMRLGAVALALGGNVRVGLEDSLYLEKGVLAKSNAEQVAKIIRIARELGLEPASPAEAREILRLKGGDKVNF